MIWRAFEMDAKREGRDLARVEGMINSCRRHLFSDDIIIEDIMAELECSNDYAKKILESYYEICQ